MVDDRIAKYAANKNIGKSWADGSRVSAIAASLVCCSSCTSNFRLIEKHQPLFLFSSSVAGWTEYYFQPSPILDRYGQV